MGMFSRGIITMAGLKEKENTFGKIKINILGLFIMEWDMDLVNLLTKMEINSKEIILKIKESIK